MERTTTNVEALWEKYKSRQDMEAREALVEYYAPLVRLVAGRMAMFMPDSVEMDDLISYGSFGLLDAVAKFQPERQIKFETYAATRIRGAILDGLRSMDWVPRSVRRKARELEQVLRELEGRLRRTPTDEEIAAALELTLDAYYQLIDEVRLTAIFSLDEAMANDAGDEPIHMIDTIRDQDVPLDDQVVKADLEDALEKALDKLSEREQMVLSLYYHEELTLKEIGYVLGVSESRVCQIHTKAIASLRSMMG